MNAAKGMVVDSETGKMIAAKGVATDTENGQVKAVKGVAVDPETTKIIKAVKGAFIIRELGNNRKER